MKIFISWSGKHSHQVATTLKEWLPYIFNGIQLFVSSEDIRKGKRWPLEVSKELDVSNFGIVCLTPDNLDAPWLLFEAGALSKSVKEASVFTLLVGGLKNSDIDGPLSHFQHTLFEKEDFFKLVSAINEGHEQAKQEAARLRKIFDKFWDELEASISKTVKSEAKPEKRQRSSEEILDKLLELTSYIARKMPDSSEPEPAQLKYVNRNLKDLILEQVGKTSAFIKGYLDDSIGMTFANNTLTIFWPAEVEENMMLVDNVRTHTLLKVILAQQGFGHDSSIVFRTASEALPPPPPPKPVPTRTPPARHPQK